MAWKKRLALTLCVSDLYDVEIEYILVAGGIRIFILGVVQCQWLIFFWKPNLWEVLSYSCTMARVPIGFELQEEGHKGKQT